jgi:hypothetical protein
LFGKSLNEGLLAAIKQLSGIAVSEQCSRYSPPILSKILSPVMGNTENTVKNSCHFSEFVRGKTLKADQVLISFDVVSLFTNIPVDLAIKVATKRLRQDATLLRRTSLPVEDIIDLLSFCLNATYLVFEGCYYQQVFGTAMGSPVSAVIANLVMEDVDQRALASVPGISIVLETFRR